MTKKNCKPLQTAKTDFTKLYGGAKKITYGKHEIKEV
jgi:hypothetical protein